MLCSYRHLILQQFCFYVPQIPGSHMVFLAVLPIAVVTVLMVALLWSSRRAMPIGWVLAVVIGFFGWNMPVRWIGAATVAGIINAIDILIIIFGALLILQLMRRSGGMGEIARSMETVSRDGRVQVLLIGWLMVCFLEAVAGFGTPAAIVAPLLIGLGFPPLVSAVIALLADSTAVTFGAVGVPVWGGFSAIEPLISDAGNSASNFDEFLFRIGSYAGSIHFAVGTFMPVVLVSVLTKMLSGSWREGLKIWPLALIAGACFTLPMMIFALTLGPELPALLASLTAFPLFILVLRLIKPGQSGNWLVPPKEQWPPGLEGTMHAGEKPQIELAAPMGVVRAWLPYILVGVVLVAGRIQAFGITPLLRYVSVGWQSIFGTSIGRSIQLLYNPGTIPFMAVALLIPFIHRMKREDAVLAWKDTVRMIMPAAVALVFTLGMVYVMIHSGDHDQRPSMLILLAETASNYTSRILSGRIWYLIAPFVGILGSFVSGSNTVSNIMFGPFQFGTALKASLSPDAVLALQAVGGAAGNMICVHNIVAVLTTVGLLGKEGIIIRKNLPVCLAYGLLAGLVGWLLVAVGGS
jgi:lactate permease